MRTLEQIEKIKKFERPPTAYNDVLSKNKIDFLLDYYKTSDKIITKNTGPKALYVEEGEGVIDDILEFLRTKYGSFELRKCQYFDVNRPHVIHNDDHKTYPNVYRAFTIPLWADGDYKDIGLVMFDQFYYHGPAKFVNGEKQDGNVFYNEFVRSYENVEYLSDEPITDKSQLTHLREHWLEGLSVHSILPWNIGDILSFECCRLHSSTDFLSKGIPSKIGLSIFTTIEEQ